MSSGLLASAGPAPGVVGMCMVDFCLYLCFSNTLKKFRTLFAMEISLTLPKLLFIQFLPGFIQIEEIKIEVTILQYIQIIKIQTPFFLFLRINYNRMSVSYVEFMGSEVLQIFKFGRFFFQYLHILFELLKGQTPSLSLEFIYV